jgi:hypothetical protein
MFVIGPENNELKFHVFAHEKLLKSAPGLNILLREYSLFLINTIHYAHFRSSRLLDEV